MSVFDKVREKLNEARKEKNTRPEVIMMHPKEKWEIIQYFREKHGKYARINTESSPTHIVDGSKNGIVWDGMLYPKETIYLYGTRVYETPDIKEGQIIVL